jgi:hypothetical protein
MQYRITLSLVLLICIALAFAGCTGTQSSPASPATGSGTGSPGTSSNLAVSPTDVVPSQNVVKITINEKDNYSAKIPVSFDGGTGQIHVTKIEATVYRSDGQVQTLTLKPEKGASIELDGTKQTDRVVVYVSFDNGDRKKTNDVLAQYRTRG